MEKKSIQDLAAEFQEKIVKGDGPPDPKEIGEAVQKFVEGFIKAKQGKTNSAFSMSQAAEEQKENE